MTHPIKHACFWFKFNSGQKIDFSTLNKVYQQHLHNIQTYSSRLRQDKIGTMQADWTDMFTILKNRIDATDDGIFIVPPFDKKKKVQEAEKLLQASIDAIAATANEKERKKKLSPFHLKLEDSKKKKERRGREAKYATLGNQE